MKIFLGLGSNLGKREERIWDAIDALKPFVHSIRLSPFYESSPVGVIDQPLFLNLVLEGTYEGSVDSLLTNVKKIEHEQGRILRERFGPREIDIDILLVDELALDTQSLTIPHPRLHERLFVLQPLMDVAPDQLIPTLGKTVHELLEQHPDFDTRSKHCRLHLPTCKHEEVNAHWIRRSFEHMYGFVFEDVLASELVNAFIDASRNLLRLPMKEKLAFKKTFCESGYTPPGVEGVGRYGIDLQREFWDIHTTGRRRSFPPTFQHLHGLSTQIYNQLETLAVDCFHALDKAYGTTIAADARDGEHMLRLSRYFSKGERDHVLFPEHFDFGLLTLYGGGAAPGLEAKYANTWHPMTATHTAGNVLVGTANTLKLYLPPGLKTFHHRVSDTNTEPEERLSYSLFTEPRGDVVLPNGQLAKDRLEAAVRRIRSS